MSDSNVSDVLGIPKILRDFILFFYFFAFLIYRIPQMSPFTWPHVKRYGAVPVVYSFSSVPLPGPPRVFKRVPPLNLDFDVEGDIIPFLLSVMQLLSSRSACVLFSAVTMIIFSKKRNHAVELAPAFCHLSDLQYLFSPLSL